MRRRELRALAKRLTTRRALEQLRRALGAVRRRAPREPWDTGRFDKPTGLHAILIGHKVKVCNLMTWARWFEATSRLDGPRGGTARHVAQTRMGNVMVSTIFLGLDHNHGWGKPAWFESMVFVAGREGKLGEDVAQWRYETWEEAEAGHAELVKLHMPAWLGVK